MESKYLIERRALKLGAKPTKKEEREKKKAKGVFFASQIRKNTGICENCGGSSHAITPSATVAHILPKGKQGCPSVALHPQNTWEACQICHDDYDGKGADFVQRMPVFPILKERVLQFYNEIAPSELRRVPEYFKPNDTSRKGRKNIDIAAKGHRNDKVVRGEKGARRAGKSK